MLSNPLNPHRALTASYDEFVAAAVRRYGANGQGVGLVLYEELVFLRHLLATTGDAPVIAARIAALREELPRYYRIDPADVTVHPTRVVAADPPVIEFDRETFVRCRYAEVAREVAAETIILASPSMEHIEARRMYLYVVDDSGKIRLWLRPFRCVDLVFGRNRARIRGVQVAHPMLVPDTLQAMSAGEVAFVGDDVIAGVVANTKSGHFRPPATSAELVQQTFTTALQLRRRDVDVIPVT